jgi:hypothetical protein
MATERCGLHRFMIDNNLKGLRGDQRRQAIPTLKGYTYQIWQSLYRWVTLKEDAVLFLEGAEDVDILGPAERAETVQIKETAGSGPVTLRSKDVVEAIVHYWEHRKNNPEVVVRFRFLTTAGRGMERSNPFGEVTGIDHWDACKRAGTNLDSLRSFLSELEALPDDLRDFIVNSSDEVLRKVSLSKPNGEKLEITAQRGEPQAIADIVGFLTGHHEKQSVSFEIDESKKEITSPEQNSLERSSKNAITD